MSLQEDIIAQLGVKPVIDPQEEIRRSIDFLKDYLQKHPFLKTFVLGISGGGKPGPVSDHTGPKASKPRVDRRNDQGSLLLRCFYSNGW